VAKQLIFRHELAILRGGPAGNKLHIPSFHNTSSQKLALYFLLHKDLTVIMDAVVRAHFNAEIGLQAVSLCPNQKYAALACRTHVQIVHLGNHHEPDSVVENDPEAISPLLRLQLSRQAGVLEIVVHYSYIFNAHLCIKFCRDMPP
jgi:hypothetical protein